MQREPPRRQGPGAVVSPPSFETKLEREEEVLDAIVSALARGQLDPATWSKLHQAATRDERMSELAFAYESYAQGRRLKLFPAAVQAELLFQAGTFFADVLGDALGGRNYLERALAIAPAHAAAFERLETLLTAAGELRKLADVTAQFAALRPKPEQIELLRRAGQLVDRAGGGDERSIELHQQLLRLDPTDAQARASLEEKYLKANRHRDVARLLEQALAAEPQGDSPSADARAMRARLIELYGSQLHEPERTMPHVEALLAVDPANDEARRAASKLVAIKGLAARAAAALADAAEKVGTPDAVARFLAIELEHTRGPKRREVFTRLGVLKQDRLGDPPGAFEAFEQALLLDPSEDDLRLRYVTLSLKLGKALDAARTLSRVASVAKDARVRARISAETGELLAAGGDVRRARATFVSVLATANVDPVAALKAARALSEIYAAEKDPKALADVLEKIAENETDPERRRQAIERLGEISSRTLKDPPRAIEAWRKLVDGPSRARALAELEPLYEGAGNAAELAWTLEERAKDATGVEARILTVRAAEVLTRAGDPAVAAAAWKRVVDKFGASREVLAQWVPLLEATRQWPELGHALAAEAQLAPESERAAIWARLGQVHLQRTRQVDLAIDALKRALALEPGEKSSRAALEKLLTQGDHRLAAAAVLEPIYRVEDGMGPALLRVLDVKASLDPDGTTRIASLAEAVTIASRTAAERPRAIELAGRGLAEAAAQGAPLRTWLARLDALAAGNIDAKRLAALLAKALGERPITSGELSQLARRVGEAHAAAGDAAAAIATFRRALDFEPTSGELLGRIDELLRDQGNPSERVALYRATIDRGGISPARRRELRHAIGALSRDELGDLPAAIASYEAAVVDDPDDRDAHAALVDLFTQTEQWEPLARLLEARIERTDAAGPEAIVLRAQLAELAASHGQAERARTHAAALLTHAELPVPALDVVERVAEELGDVSLARAVLERRANAAEDAREQVGWLTRLGILENEQASDPEAAARAWTRAAALAQSAGDDAIARDLYVRVRGVAPLDAHASARLAELLERAEEWERLPELYEVLVRTAPSPAEAVAALLRTARLFERTLNDPPAAMQAAERAFALVPSDPEVLATYERLAIAAKETSRFARVLEEAIGHAVGGEPALRADFALSRARALASDPATREEAIATYRTLLGGRALDAERSRAAAAALVALLEAEDAAAHRADWRWLLEWRVGRAPDGEKGAALLAWAAIEESRLLDPARALALHREVLGLDPDNAEAMAAIARIALATGDVDAAVFALVARRDRSEGAARAALDLEIATVLLDRGVRRMDALRSVASVLESTPSDGAALDLSARLLTAEETRTAAMGMLEKTLDGVDDVDVRAQILTRLLETPSDAASRDLRRGWFERLLDLRQERGELDLALATVVRAAEELPTVDSLWERAEELARALRRPDEVAALYAKVLGSRLSHDEALALGQRAVAFHEEWFEDSERVVRILERVLEIDPTDPWAFDRLKLIFDAASRWDDLFTLFDRAIAAASGARRVELLEDAAQVAKDFASRSERAIGYLEQLLALRPSDARLSASLERLYERHGRHRELVQLLHARVADLPGREAQATRARIAGLLLDELEDAASALSVVEELIARDGTDGAIDVAPLLERILAVAPPNAEVRDSIVPPPEGSERPSRASVAPPGAPKRVLVRHRAAALLKDRYAQSGRDADLVRVLEIELETVRSVKERIRRHRQIAELYGGLGREGDALEHAVSLVLLEPDVAAHREQLANLAQRVGRDDRLAEVLVSAADDCTDDALRIELLMHAGVVHQDALGDDARAIDLFFRVLDVHGHDAAHLAAARRLAPLLEKAGRARDRLDVTERLAGLETDREARHRALGEVATLATALGESERAITAWQLRLRDDERDEDALAGLAALYEKERRWRPLIDILSLRAQTRTGDARRADLVRAAEVLRRELGAIDEAIAAWRAIEDETGPSEESTRALASLLRAASMWSELAVVLERAVRGARGAARADLSWELGDVRRTALGDPAGAVKAYEDALEIDPRHAGARSGLLGIVLGDGTARARAVEVLLATYRATDEWRAVLGLLEPRLAVAESDGARVDVLREAATIAESQADDREGAFGHLRRALLLDPSGEELAVELRRLAEVTHAWRPLADTYRDALEKDTGEAGSPAWTARLQLALGDVLDARLDDPRGALASYERVLAESPTQAAATHAAVKAAARVARWDAVAKVLVDAAAAEGSVDASLAATVEGAMGGAPAWDGVTSALGAALAERGAQLPPLVARELEARLGEWHRDKRSDPDAAEQAFTRALGYAVDGTAEDAMLLVALTELQRRTRGRPLVDSLLRLSAATGGDLDLLREAADVARTSVGDRGLAKSIAHKVMTLAMEQWTPAGEEARTVSSGQAAPPAAYVEWAVGQLVELHEEEDDPARVVDLLVEAARLPFSRERSRAMRHDAARVALEKLNDVDRGVRILGGLVEDDPEDTSAITKLLETLDRHGRKEELLAVRRKQVEAAKHAPLRVAVRLEQARLELSMGDTEAAVRSLRANLEEDPRHEESVLELSSLLERGDRSQDLVGLFAEQASRAEGAQDTRAAADLWARAAEVAVEKLGDPGRAIEMHRHVIALEPRATSLDALARLLSARGEWAEAATHLSTLLAASDEASAGAVSLRLAEALASSGDDAAARARLEEAAARDPSAEEVVARLGALYREHQEWRPLAELLARSAGRARDKAARLKALREAADLYRRRVGDPSAAIPLLEQASDLEPEDRGLRVALADALGAATRYDDARSVLRALIEGFGGRRPKERAPVHYALSRLDLAMGDRAQALVELDAATRIDPANPEILQALAELARDDGQTERAERSYRALLAVLRRSEDPPEDAPIVRAEVLVELATIARGSKEPERAEELVESALEIAARSPVEARRLEGALRTRGDLATLARALEARVTRGGGEPEDLASALADLARVQELLGRTESSLASHLRAVTLAPHVPARHVGALEAARSAGAVRRYVDLLVTLGREAEERGDEDVACELALRAGAVLEQDLGDDAEAARLYERAERFQLRLPDVLRALDRIYERLGDSAAQARVLAKRIDIESMSSAAGVTTDALYRLARLKLLDAKGLDEGCDLLDSALRVAPDAPRAVAVLEAATALHPGAERLVDIYERVGRAPGQERALVSALTLRADLPGVGAEPLREAVVVARRLGDGALAESLLRRLIERAGDDAAVRPLLTWALVTLADLREGEDVAEAVTLKRRAADLADDAEARRLHFEVARLAKERLGDMALAARMYEELHQRDPADREAWEPLLEVHRASGEHAKRAALIARVVDFVDEPAERSRLRLERAKVTMSELGAGDDAAPMLQEIVDEDPSQVEAALLLAGILERHGKDDELADLLARQIESAKDRADAASVAELSLRLGTLVEKRAGGAPDEARSVYYAALEWEPKNRELLRRLVRLHAPDEDPHDRADAMERLLPLEEASQVEDLARTLSDVRKGLGDEDGARRAIEQGFRVHPQSAILRDRLEETYAAGGEWAKLAELYETEAQALTEKGPRVARLREAARVWRDRASEPTRASEVLRRARTEAPENVELLGELVDLLAAGGDKAAATLELTLALDWLGEQSAEIGPLLERRATLRDELGDEDGALFDLEHALRVGGARHAPKVVAYLERLVSSSWDAGDSARWRAMRLRLAEVLPVAGDPETARMLLGDLLKHDAKDRDALRALALLEERAESWDAASATYRRLVALEDPARVVDTALRLADACEKAGRLGDARGGLERARMAAPANEALTARLLALYDATGAFRELAALHLEEAKQDRDVAGRFEHLLAGGTLLLEHGSDPSLALVPLREANALRPENLECSARLAEGLAAVGKTQEATELLTALLAPHRGRRSRELAGVHQAFARVARAARDTQGELASLTSALDMDPQNGAVASELALVAREAGQLELAQRALRAVTMLKSPAPLSRGLAYQYLGEIAQKQGDVKRAVMLLTRAVDDDPNLAGAKALLSQLKAE